MAVASQASHVVASSTSGVIRYSMMKGVDYKIGGFSIAVQERWRNAEKQSGNPTLVFSDHKVPAAAFTDMTLSYNLKPDRGPQAEFFLSVQSFLEFPNRFCGVRRDLRLNVHALYASLDHQLAGGRRLAVFVSCLWKDVRMRRSDWIESKRRWVFVLFCS